MATIEQIKQLREETGSSPVDIKKALDEAGGDFGKAKELLSLWGKKVVGKKADREVKEGVVDFYVHPNAKSGVLLDIRCETDFVAKSPEFKTLAHEICLQIAALKAETIDSLLEQPWVKNDSKTIKALIEESISKIGEHIEIKQFSRFEI